MLSHVTANDVNGKPAENLLAVNAKVATRLFAVALSEPLLPGERRGRVGIRVTLTGLLVALFCLQPGVGLGSGNETILRERGKRDARVHDPSSIVKGEGAYWLFATGQGIRSWRSADLVQWERGPRVFEAYDSAHLSGEPVRADARPWARWWWLGSAVDETNLTVRLTEYRDAGFGGVEICPIYGVHGWEERHVPFLSEAWMEMLAHTTREAERLGLGIDLTTGTGWPFGGPWVQPRDASGKALLKRFDLASGEEVVLELPKGEVACGWAVEAGGEQRDVTEQLQRGRMDWVIPNGEQWRLYVVVRQAPAQRVKRAAPGGEGSVLDPYSVGAVERYLGHFDQAFEGYRGLMPRAHFHDSFEYYGAQWTPTLFDAFQARHDYDLRAVLPGLFGEGPEEHVARVKHDYRETLASMHGDYLRAWTRWAHGYGSLTRNQAHGAPANLIDLYAAVDIPETEIFGATEEKYFPMQKFASSAAHVMGHRLVSAEAFTWLNEHFQTSLAQLKQAADYLFLSGVNHLVYHGIPYSPVEAAWPGWQFYAAVNFGPDGGLWRDLPAFNDYVTRCQTMLQSGEPSNEVLLYFPFHDLLQDPAGLLRTFTVHNVGDWLEPNPFHAAAMRLLGRGYNYDAISDALLRGARSVGGQVVTPGGTSYQVILVPRTTFMPETTLRQLITLAEAGATVLMLQSPPLDVPGLARLTERRRTFRTALEVLSFGPAAQRGREIALGQGRVVLGNDLEDLLQTAGVAREPMVDHGLRYVRRRQANGYDYFVANRTDQPVDRYVSLGVEANYVMITDPIQEERAGMAAVRRNRKGETEFRLRLEPGDSCLLRTFDQAVDGVPAWGYDDSEETPVTLTGTWQVRFVDGGPALPGSFECDELFSWTERDDPRAHAFFGTAQYTLEFNAPALNAVDWWLDLGRVHESARVTLNGHSLGTLWRPPFRARVGGALRAGRNRLEIEVTNLAANRVADLDRRKVQWKYFYDANVVNKDYRPFDASDWPLFDSGLGGPVTLRPVMRGTGKPLVEAK